MRDRLRHAAVALFAERGYERTTAAGIAAAAGVTERTFFRHFPDKREVLFDGEAVLRAALDAALADLPAEIAPLEALFRAFERIVPLLEGNRAFSEPRQRLIATTPALAERELAKTAALADALADALRRRGVDDLPALLAARTGMVAFVQAIVAWLDDPAIGLSERLNQARGALAALFSVR